MTSRLLARAAAAVFVPTMAATVQAAELGEETVPGTGFSARVTGPLALISKRERDLSRAAALSDWAILLPCHPAPTLPSPTA